jgi:hypothetical protein
MGKVRVNWVWAWWCAARCGQRGGRIDHGMKLCKVLCTLGINVQTGAVYMACEARP